MKHDPAVHRHFHHSNDGFDHINIYSRGKTWLGQELSHFPRRPFVHPYFGSFQSMEGFWYYLKTGMCHERLRELWGAEAKFYGKSLEARKLLHFNTLIIDANYQKIIDHPEIVKALKDSSLPFDHYYTFAKQNTIKQVRMAGFDWLVEGFESIRRLVKDDEKMPVLDYNKLLLEQEPMDSH